MTTKRSETNIYRLQRQLVVHRMHSRLKMATALSFLSTHPIRSQVFFPKIKIPFSSPSPPIPKFKFDPTHLASAAFDKQRRLILPCSSIPIFSTATTHYEFYDETSEIELRLELRDQTVSPGEIFVDASENSLVIKVQHSGYLKTLLDTSSLYGTIKPSETIWYIDDSQLVVNLKKQDPELKWPDIMESWESLTTGVAQLLKGTSIFLVGESTEINYKIARELAVGLGYTPLSTKELLEQYIKRTIDSWETEEGPDAVAEAEGVIIESLSSQARAIVATLGAEHGAARRPNKWQHLFGGFTLWLSQSEATDEESAKEETKKNIQDGVVGYTNAEVVVKLGGWDASYSKSVSQASLSALKCLILSDQNLPGRKSLYVRLGCRGDWPDIKPPGWDPSTGTGSGIADAGGSTLLP